MDSPLSKLKKQGVASLSSVDLAAIAFTSESDDSEAALASARRFLLSLGSIRALASTPPDMLRELGLSELETAKFLCLVELGRRSSDAGRGERDEISSAADVYRIFSHLREERKEHFCALYLDSKNKVLRNSTVHVGTVSASMVGVSEVFRDAVREGAASIIVVHNHPSGDPTPSPEDFEVTRILADAGKLMGIPLLDHIIIGECEFKSMHELGAIS